MELQLGSCYCNSFCSGYRLRRRTLAPVSRSIQQAINYNKRPAVTYRGRCACALPSQPRSAARRLRTQAYPDGSGFDPSEEDLAAAAMQQVAAHQQLSQHQQQQQRQENEKVVEAQKQQQQQSPSQQQHYVTATDGPPGGTQQDDAREQRIQQQQVQGLYEGRYGLPVVRRYLQYDELLRDIREEKVAEVYFFTEEEQQLRLEGVCIVKYRDESLAQSLVPPSDVRIRLAMENHGVESHLLEPKPQESLLQPNVPFSEKLEKRITTWLPWVGILAVYGAAQIAAKLKGDAEDRDKLRAADVEKSKQMNVERDVDARFLEAEEMANMGLSLEDILVNLDRVKVPYDRQKVVAMVATIKQTRGIPNKRPQKSLEYFNTEAAQQAKTNEEAKAKKAEEEGEGDPMDNAANFLKLSTAKFTKAADPEEERLRIKMRAAKRKMKGVNLQYVADRRVFFDDVAGVGEAKVELQEVVDFFTKPALFRGSGARVPRGVLLCGPPGTGKTLLARAVAGESGVAFLSLNASEFVEMFVGVGAARVRDLFNQARNLKPCIIFMDEIDAVGRARGGDQGNDERDTTLNQLLSEMDGFGNVEETGVIVMAATNRRDVLDPALIRPGRFDRIIYIGAPDYEGRIETLLVHLRGRPVEDNIDLSAVAFETAGYTGARLSNLVNTAGGFVGKAGRDTITQQDLLDAITWERTGPERQAPSRDRQRRVAVQEAATSLTATLMPAIEPVQRVTIASFQKLPLGHTILALNEAREMTNQFTARYLKEQLIVVLSGRAAEEAIYGHDDMSTVNQRSLAMARRIAQKLVVSGGLSGGAQLPPGPLSIPVPMEAAMGQIIPQHVTPRMHAAADEAMSEILSEGYVEASRLIARNRTALEALMTGLLERTTLTGDQVREIAERDCHPEDLARRSADKAAFL